MIIKDDIKLNIQLPITNNDCKVLNNLITSLILKNYRDKLNYLKTDLEDLIQDCWVDFLNAINRKFKEGDIISYGFLLSSCKFTICNKFKKVNLKKNLAYTNSVSLDDKIDTSKNNPNFDSRVYELLSDDPKEETEINRNDFNKILNVFEKRSNTNKMYAQSSSYIKYLFAYYAEDKINVYGEEKFDSLDLDWTTVENDESNLFTVIAQKLGYENSSDVKFRFLKTFVKNTLSKNNVKLEDFI